MLRLALSAGVILLCGTAVIAAEGVVLNADNLKWGDAPPQLPKGAKLAVVSGDPGGNGPFVVRVMFPANYKVAPHNHAKAENVTVLSGNFHIGMGDKFDQSKGQELKAGGFVQAPAGMNHYAWSTSETVIQIHGEGPFALNYVNPADDPSKTQ
jgi:quercetin dioxygenase-like cupin family protein